jgi:hypothetical protein
MCFRAYHNSSVLIVRIIDVDMDVIVFIIIFYISQCAKGFRIVYATENFPSSDLTIQSPLFTIVLVLIVSI